MSDNIILMNGGAIEKRGMPHALYFKPRTLLAEKFPNDSNRFSCAMRDTITFQAIVFIFKFTQPLHIGWQQSTILLLPTEICRLAASGLTAEISYRSSTFLSLLENERFLRIREPDRFMCSSPKFDDDFGWRGS